MDWIIENAAVLIAAIIGVIGALLGVIITFCLESKKQRKERIEKAKPIIINYMVHQIDDRQHTPVYLFSSSDDNCTADITGVFKNTDNAILFFDYIKTETKKYYPQHSSAVDKNTVFYVKLEHIEGETLKKCVILCHDIYDTPYYYNAHFCFNSGCQSQIIIDNIMPIKRKS